MMVHSDSLYSVNTKPWLIVDLGGCVEPQPDRAETKLTLPAAVT